MPFVRCRYAERPPTKGDVLWGHGDHFTAYPPLPFFPRRKNIRVARGKVDSTTKVFDSKRERFRLACTITYSDIQKRNSLPMESLCLGTGIAAWADWILQA